MNELEPPIRNLIPVNKNKQPLVSWKKYQTQLPTDEEIEKWKLRYNGRISGWAMPCGMVSGIVVLDFDGEIGVNTMNELGLIPNVKTPGNGFHVWLKAPDYPTRTGAIDNHKWPGMELKGDGGYVLVIGEGILSAHAGSSPVTGNYEILRIEPTLIEDLDDELAEFIGLRKEDVEEEAIVRLITEAIELSKTGRNDAGFWLATQLRDLGLRKQDTLSFMLNEFLPRVSQNGHAYTAKEVRASIDSAYSKTGKIDRQSQVDIAVSLIKNDKHELWHDGKDGYVTTPEGLNFQLFSKQFRSYLSGYYFSSQSTAISLRIIDEAATTLDAIAKKDGKQYEPKLRIGWLNDSCFVDTGKYYYEITSDGYNQVEKAPVKFLRNETMGILPNPLAGNGWSYLRQYVNVNEEDWPLIQANCLAPFMPKGAFPIFAFTGSHGSGKSTTLSAVIQAVDPRPNVDSIRDAMPKDRRNMAIVAKHSFVLAFDNESHISKEISDALAMLSTGGQFKIRTLYENDSLNVFTAKRLVIVNSIGDLITESDLLDRSIIIECPPLVEKQLDSEMWMAYERELPYIVHSIFSSVSNAIQKLNEKVPPKNFRMTDFVRWSLAAEIEGFLEAYTRVVTKAPLISIHNSLIGSYILRLIHQARNDRTQERYNSAAEYSKKPEYVGWAYVGTFDNFHQKASAESDEWFKTVQGAINGYKRVQDSLSKVGVRVEVYEYDNQDWIAIEGNEI